MIIFVNGAPKTGSTWLRHIIAEIIDFQEIPEPYQNKSWGKIGAKRSISQKKLKSFFQKVDYTKINYISKNHFHRKQELELIINQENCKVFCIERDLRDVVVSYYYHQIRKETLNCDFKTYYWRYGRYFVEFMVQYQKTWHLNHPNIYISSYEGLKEDFLQECIRVANFMGIQLDENQASNIKEATSLNNMRKKWGEEEKSDKKKFFRKGIVGDWENHFENEIINDFEIIQNKGLSGLPKLRYNIIYPFRLFLLNEYNHIVWR